MASFRDFMSDATGMYGASSDDLIRSAQMGNLKAYKELIRRGEEIPPPGDPAGRFGSHGRPGGAPTPVLGLERPAYLDRGISRNMARPAQAPSEPQPLPFMSAINPPQQEAPSYLGMGMGEQAPDDDPIQRIADGNDAAAPIQQGASAADTDSGATPTDPASVIPGPLGALASAMESDDPNGYSGYIGDIIRSLQEGVNPEQNKRMALAQAGFAMAGSGSPFFFQAVGQGGLAGMKAYRESQEQDMENQVRAAGLAGKELERGEDIRKSKADEAHDTAVLGETKRSNVETEKERVRSNRASEAISQGQLSISSQNAQTSLGHLQIAQRNFEEEKQRYDEGKGDAQALRKSEIRYRDALAKSQEALEIDRNTEILYAPEGAYIYNKQTGEAAPITGKDGKQIKASAKSFAPTAEMKNNKYWVEIGLFPDERMAAAARLQGKTMSPDRRLVEAYELADGKLASHPEMIMENADAAREEWAQQYYEMLGGDAAPAGASGTPSREGPSSAAPGSNPYKSPDDVKRDFQAGKITKDQARQYIEQMQRGQ